MHEVWPGDMSFLKDLDNQVKAFIWDGQEDSYRPRLDYSILIRFTEEGGLGVILIKAHTIAIAGKRMLWITTNGKHTLQCILWVKLVQLSINKWGIEDYSWLVAPSRNLLLTSPSYGLSIVEHGTP